MNDPARKPAAENPYDASSVRCRILSQVFSPGLQNSYNGKAHHNMIRLLSSSIRCCPMPLLSEQSFIFSRRQPYGKTVKPVYNCLKLGGNSKVIQRSYKYHHVGTHNLLFKIFSVVILTARTVHSAEITAKAWIKLCPCSIEYNCFMSFFPRSFNKIIRQQI